MAQKPRAQSQQKRSDEISDLFASITICFPPYQLHGLQCWTLPAHLILFSYRLSVLGHTIPSSDEVSEALRGLCVL